MNTKLETSDLHNDQIVQTAFHIITWCCWLMSPLPQHVSMNST